LDSMHKVYLNERVMSFTFENHTRLGCNFSFTTSNFLLEWEWQRPRVRKIQQLGIIFFDA